MSTLRPMEPLWETRTLAVTSAPLHGIARIDFSESVKYLDAKDIKHPL